MWRVLDLVAFCDLDELSRFAGTPAPPNEPDGRAQNLERELIDMD